MNMKDMYSTYVKRHKKMVDALENNVRDVFCACEDAAETIPDDQIYQVIAREFADGTQRECWMYIEPMYLEKGNLELMYSLGTEAVTGKIKMAGFANAIEQLEKFVQEKYKMPIKFREFCWGVKYLDVKLSFTVSLSSDELEEHRKINNGINDLFCPKNILEKMSILLIADLKENFLDVEISYLDDADTTKMIITINDTV